MFSYDLSENLNGNPSEYTHPEDLPMVLSVLDRIFKEPSHIPVIQYRFLDKKGNWKWIESTFSNLLDDPNVESIVINFRDIHDRQLAEKKLLESEEKYRMIADNTDDWIYWQNPDGSLKYTSPSCKRLTGYIPNDFMNDPQLIDKITYPEDFPIVERHHAQIKEFRSSDNMEYRIVTKDNKILWIQHSCSPIFNQDGVYAGRRGVNRNISDRKLAEMKILGQLSELQRWYKVTLDREDRNRELKKEVNVLLLLLGKPIRYPSQENKETKAITNQKDKNNNLPDEHKLSGESNNLGNRDIENQLTIFE
jgi:PAS domain S-box-containing protein